jgi:hypothetical protein
MNAELERLRAEHNEVFGADSAPDWAKESLAAYVEHGVPTGDCLRAFLANDLMNAIARADVETGRKIAAIAGYIYNRVPRAAHGSYERVDAWILKHRERREAEQAGQ